MTKPESRRFEDGYAWVDDGSAPLLTDLYQITMMQAYWREQMLAPAVFSLFARRLPKKRNFLLACGLEDCLRYLETLRFDAASLAFLRSRPELQDDFIDWLADFRFTGNVWAVLEGTPVFANEPILEVKAPLPEAQLVESFVMNQIHHQTVVASKAARVVHAAAGRRVLDFGMRRMHGADAALKSARAFYIAGINATSNVLAGRVFGVPIAGTMAHSYIQAHAHEAEALRAFADLYPETILLVDTYDTLEGIRKVIDLARTLGPSFAVRGVRLDSGDLLTLSRQARQLLDDAGLGQVALFASGGLDEYEVDRLVRGKAPISGFGVGTSMGVSADAPYLDLVYKLTSYDGVGRVKTAPGKPIWPGRKQVFRCDDGAESTHDLIVGADEEAPGEPLLVPVMEHGQRLPIAAPDLEGARRRAHDAITRLPRPLRSLEPMTVPYSVTISSRLEAARERAIAAAVA